MWYCVLQYKKVSNLSAISEARAKVLERLYEKSGFHFEERELSPRLRKQVGKLEEDLQYIWHLMRLRSSGEDTKSSSIQYIAGAISIGLFSIILGAVGGYGAMVFVLIGMIISIFSLFIGEKEGGVLGFGAIVVFGFLSIVAIFYMVLESGAHTKVGGGGEVAFGIITLVIGYAIYRFVYQSAKSGRQRLESQVSSKSAEWDAEVDTLSKEVYNELSEIHEQKVRPKVKELKIDFASLLQQTRGKGFILETIECPNCGGKVTIPKTGNITRCQHCGKDVYAVDIFERFKQVLGL